MKLSLQRFTFLTAAVAGGAIAFGLFWSGQAHAVTTAGGPFCPPNSSTSCSQNATMCYNGQTVTVGCSTQTTYLKNGGTCGACATSGN